LTGESIPTYLPGYWLSCYFGILSVYLPRDWFLPSELAVPLVDAHYSLSPGLSYMEVKIGCKYKGHSLFSWSLEGSFQNCW
jgi:hypothetical protein